MGRILIVLALVGSAVAVVVGARATTNAAITELGECARASLELAPALDAPISREQAERQSGAVGARGVASASLLGHVTLGIADERPPVEVLPDMQGVPIKDRLAWVLVFRGQSIARPGGPSIASEPPRPITTLLTVVDASTGKFLAGWSCD